MIESLIVRGVILCAVAGFLIYVIICACAELMNMRDDDDDNDRRGGE